MSRRRRGAVNYQAGLAAEDCVARHYAAGGYAIEASRWRGMSGEIDLVLRRGAALVFVEVKKSADFLRAAEALSARQLARIMRAADEYLATTATGAATDVRIDLGLVDGAGRTHVIENISMG